MSLSSFDSFQSRFVSYLLNRPRITPGHYSQWNSYLHEAYSNDI